NHLPRTDRRRRAHFLGVDSHRLTVARSSARMSTALGGAVGVRELTLTLDPLDGSLYLFLGKDRRRLKVLYWERNGFCMWQKRLERDRFPWPKDEGSVRELDEERLTMLLSGIDFWNAHQTLLFTKAG
ncbi:MAG: IS66 family insertion sequence element accessory protein TnpB, partial [Spirochaetes bacterium]|nr:IS66 family insertion sequence element accessory protein TnpB [Spirochaetota bacterium]